MVCELGAVVGEGGAGHPMPMHRDERLDGVGQPRRHTAQHGREVPSSEPHCSVARTCPFTSSITPHMAMGYACRLPFMDHLWQPVRAHYRPLAFYAAIELLAGMKHCMMLAAGFRPYRHAGERSRRRRAGGGAVRGPRRVGQGPPTTGGAGPTNDW